MATSFTITVPASRYEDHDDCLAAAAAYVARTRRLAGWDLGARWVGGDSGQREEIALDIPAWALAPCFRGEGAERVSTEPYPVEHARAYCAWAEGQGREVSWAPDGEDPSTAWIYEVAS